MKRLLAVLLEAAPLALSPHQVTAGSIARPNIVVIMTDDQRWDTVTPKFMPNLTSRMVSGVNATYFTNSFVPNALCCPSRTSTLTGEYSHTTGVYNIKGTYGGFHVFNQDNDTIATTLHANGYRTGLIGKYLNGYNPKSDYGYTPPGWDRWNALRTGDYYDYWMTGGGGVSHFGSEASDYSGRVMDARAQTFITGGNQSKPFFLYFAPSAPHKPTIADPLDVGKFEALGLPSSTAPSIGEDVSDKPSYVKARTWNTTIQAQYEARRLKQFDAIYSMDRLVGDVWDAVPNGTVVVFMSDNGFLLGEHGWGGKGVPYNESIRVPMVLAVKGGPAPSLDPDRIVLNVDLRETLEGYAGITVATAGQDWNSDPVRARFVLEHWNDPNTNNLTHCGVRSVDWMYVKYSTGEEELYDEANDPYELTNVASSNPEELSFMRARAQNLCTGGAIYPPDWPFH